MRRISRSGIAVSICVLHLAVLVTAGLLFAGGDPLSASTGSANELRPRLTVDSTFAGYGTDVLTDRKWIELGKELTQDYGHRDRLGNGGNSWVSEAVEGVEHWVRLDWPRPVEIQQLAVWWTQPDWYPKAFRVESLRGQSWVAVTPTGEWWVPTAQHSVLTFPAIQAQTLRVVQHPRGGPDRGFLALQEIDVVPQAAARLSGVRPLSPEEVRALTPPSLERNLARLHEDQPGADEAVAWPSTGEPVSVATLQDGDVNSPASLPARSRPGVRWPIQHVLDGGALLFAALPEPGTLTVEIHNGKEWGPLKAGFQVTRDVARRALVFSCEPVATKAVRLDLPEGTAAVTELEVYRCLPASPDVWPQRLVTANQYERQVLANGREPSFEELSTAALSMMPTHTLLGLKDAAREIGVTWDGTIVSQWPLRFSFGDQREVLAACRDTVTRRLIDDWRPGVVVQGCVRDLRITETAFVSFLAADRTRPACLVRLVVENLGSGPVQTAVHVRLEPKAREMKLIDGVVVADGQAILIASGGSSMPEPGRLVVPLALPAHAQGIVDFVQPCGESASSDQPAHYREARFDDALREFRRYWDELLAPAARLELPEPRLVNAYKAILTQLFINADGDVMPYASDPSWYSGRLYGIEEGYAMMALAHAGFLRDAQRYMDGTYLTPQFLVKVPKYAKYADRHQQYRNGLQPHYAVSAYRLSRDKAWVAKHLPLLRECAEWTLAERRKTMVLENGQKPLHYGLLPKWSYGGDISELQCYALYANFACWKGLVDTAWLLQELGDTETSGRYSREAADYWSAIERAVEGNYRRDRQPPFLPLELYAKQPVGNDYDQLFAGTLLHLQALDVHGRQIRYVTDFLEQDNRTFCLLPRFRRDVGPGGLDGLYGLGYILAKLHQDRIAEFLLGFYGYLAFNLERDTFAARETNLIYASDLHLRSRYKVPEMSDPLPCSSAVALQLLRHMLVSESPPVQGKPQEELRLLYGAPRAWFAQGQAIRLERVPSEFGEVNLEVLSRVADGRIEAIVRPPQRNAWHVIQLRLRHPEGRPMRRALLNGQPWNDVDAPRELITLRPGSREYRLMAEF